MPLYRRLDNGEFLMDVVGPGQCCKTVLVPAGACMKHVRVLVVTDAVHRHVPPSGPGWLVSLPGLLIISQRISQQPAAVA